MPVVVRSIETGKIRCPKCSAVLVEPPVGVLIYRCSSCLAILQASPPRDSEDDVERTQREDGAQYELQAGLAQRRSGQNSSEFANPNTISSDESNGFSLTDSSDGRMGMVSDEHSADGYYWADEGQPLYRSKRRTRKASLPRTNTFVTETDAATDEQPLYIPRFRRLISQKNYDASVRGSYYGRSTVVPDRQNFRHTSPAVDRKERAESDALHMEGNVGKFSVNRPFSNPSVTNELRQEMATRIRELSGAEADFQDEHDNVDYGVLQTDPSKEMLQSGHREGKPVNGSLSNSKSIEELQQEMPSSSTRLPDADTLLQEDEANSHREVTQKDVRRGLLSSTQQEEELGNSSINASVPDPALREEITRLSRRLPADEAEFQHEQGNGDHGALVNGSKVAGRIHVHSGSFMPSSVNGSEFLTYQANSEKQPFGVASSLVDSEFKKANAEVDYKRSSSRLHPKSQDASYMDPSSLGSQAVRTPDKRQELSGLDLTSDIPQDKVTRYSRDGEVSSLSREGNRHCSKLKKTAQEKVLHKSFLDSFEISRGEEEQTATDSNVVKHEAYPDNSSPILSCEDSFNFTNASENEREYVKSCYGELLTRDETENGTSELEFPRVDTESRREVHNTLSRTEDCELIEYASTLDEATEENIGSPFLWSVDSDPFDGRAIRTNIDVVPQVETSETNLYSPVQRKAVPTSRHIWANEDTLLVWQGPLQFVLNQDTNVAMGQNNVHTESCSEYYGYGQMGFNFQDPKPSMNKTQRIPGDEDKEIRNALYSQRMARNEEDGKTEVMKPTRDVKAESQGHFSDLEQKLESGRKVTENGKTSVPYCSPEQSCIAEANGLQRRVPHTQPTNQGFTTHAYSFQPPQAVAMPMSSCDHPFMCCPQYLSHPLCAYCIQHSHMQHCEMLHGTLQNNCTMCISQPHCVSASQHSLPHQYFTHPMAHFQPSLCHPDASSSPHVSFGPKGHMEGSVVNQNNSVDQSYPEQRLYPPFPMKGAAPYVLCHHCDSILLIPSKLPQNNGHIKKLRCGACMKVSKFSMLHILAKSPVSSKNVPAKSQLMTDEVLSLSMLSSGLRKDASDEIAFHPSRYESPLFLGTHARGLNRTPASGIKVPAAHENSFDRRNADRNCCTSSHFGYISSKQSESYPFSKIPTPTAESSDLARYPGTSVATAQSQEISRQGFASGKLESMVDETLQKGMPKNQARNGDTFRTPSPSSNLGGSSHWSHAIGDQIYEESVKQKTGGNIVNSLSSELNAHVQPVKGYFSSHRDNTLNAQLQGEIEHHSAGDTNNSCDAYYAKRDTYSNVVHSRLHEHFGYDSPSDLVGTIENTPIIFTPTKGPQQKPNFPNLSKSVTFGGNKNAVKQFLLRGSRSYRQYAPEQDAKNGRSAQHSAVPWSPVSRHAMYNPPADFDDSFEWAQGVTRSHSQSPSQHSVYSSTAENDEHIGQAREAASVHSLHSGFSKDNSSAEYGENRQQTQESVKDSTHSKKDSNRKQKSLTSFLKSGLKKLAKGSHGRAISPQRVVINGYVIPDDTVRKAEEQAGTIHPGSYWYDFQAGFWGMMGGPCLGIIPPFIDEFNYPIRRECSGGKTGVLVNGRELHWKDLEILSCRGLPRTPGKAYAIEISGRVVNEVSGKELPALGKLAPAVEIKGSGFGMFQPPLVTTE